MVRHRRKLLAETLLLGVALSLIVIVADRAGLVRPLENWFSDQRTLRCQQFTPPPTTQLVHLDIDDRAVELLRWPWQRNIWAEVFDELARAKPKVVATDILFPDPEAVTLERASDGSVATVDHDALFAAAIRGLGCAIIPASLFTDKEVVSPLGKAMLEELKGNLELTEEALIANMRRKGLIAAGEERRAADLYFAIRREAVFQLVYALLSRPSSPATQPSDAIQTLLRLAPDGIDYSSPLTSLLRSEFTRAQTIVSLRRLAAAKPPNSSPLATAVGGYYAPALPLTLAAQGTGFVDRDFYSDSALRNLPLLAEHDGRFYPQLGLALALKMLDVDLKTVRFTSETVTIPRTGRDIIIPVHTGVSGAKERGVPMLFDIPWFGTRDWGTMYDPLEHRRVRQHVPMLKVLSVGQVTRKIIRNSQEADAAMLTILVITNQDRAAAYDKARPALDAVAPRLTVMEKVLADPDVKDLQSQLSSLGPSELDVDSRKFLAAHKQLQAVLPQLRDLQKQLESQRRELADDLGGKAVLIGWTATGSDFVPTPLHDRCPGVVVHGAVFNAIMTENFWRTAPVWAGITLTVLFGIVTAGMSVGLSAGRALLCAVLMLTVYLLLNGLLMFGFFRIRLPIATPALAIGFVWAMCTLYRIIIETQERDHIKARFQTYADPMLVDHVLEHPDKVRFDGEVKELTVAFTDLANFTSISEELGERSVALLNEYLGCMVPIIREHNGFVNKFFGDGIMFFYGAPVENPRHAADAVKTALDMQAAMGPLNERMAAEGFPRLTVRAGICTGSMVVGDAGTRGRSDYTVLGDPVNLGSRLEGANKTLGTLVLVSARTAASVEGQYLFRPVGRLRVVGKTEAVEVFEAICAVAEATEQQKRTVELTTTMVNAYKARQLVECLAVITALDEHLQGATKLTQLYHEMCERNLREPTVEWDGVLALAEK